MTESPEQRQAADDKRKRAADGEFEKGKAEPAPAPAREKHPPKN